MPDRPTQAKRPRKPAKNPLLQARDKTDSVSFPFLIQSRIDWGKVVDQGTGFFGRPNYDGTVPPQDCECRTITFYRLKKLDLEGLPLQAAFQTTAEQEFWVACLLYLAELSAEHHRDPRLKDHPTHQSSIIVLRERLDRFPNDLGSRWEKLKAALSCHVDVSRMEKQDQAVAEALRLLRPAFNKNVLAIRRRETRSGDDRKKLPGPDVDSRIWLVISGLTDYMNKKFPDQPKTQKPPRLQTLVYFLEQVWPTLPISLPVEKPDELRKAIGHFRDAYQSSTKALPALKNAVTRLGQKYPH